MSFFPSLLLGVRGCRICSQRNEKKTKQIKVNKEEENAFHRFVGLGLVECQEFLKIYIYTESTESCWQLLPTKGRPTGPPSPGPGYCVSLQHTPVNKAHNRCTRGGPVRYRPTDRPRQTDRQHSGVGVGVCGWGWAMKETTVWFPASDDAYGWLLSSARALETGYVSLRGHSTGHLLGGGSQGQRPKTWILINRPSVC